MQNAKVYMVNFFFFDAHGGLWRTVSPIAAPKYTTVAFGPTGLAREAGLYEAGLRNGTGTAWARAKAQGRLIRGDDGWDRLAD